MKNFERDVMKLVIVVVGEFLLFSLLFTSIQENRENAMKHKKRKWLLIKKGNHETLDEREREREREGERERESGREREIMKGRREERICLEKIKIVFFFFFKKMKKKISVQKFVFFFLGVLKVCEKMKF